MIGNAKPAYDLHHYSRNCSEGDVGAFKARTPTSETSHDLPFGLCAFFCTIIFAPVRPSASNNRSHNNGLHDALPEVSILSAFG
jgi:hypothetical protein